MVFRESLIQREVFENQGRELLWCFVVEFGIAGQTKKFRDFNAIAKEQFYPASVTRNSCRSAVLGLDWI